MHAERAQKFIRVECFRTENFGEFAATDPAMHFELPQPVTRMHEADGERQILFRLRLNGRNAVAINADDGFAKRTGQRVLRGIDRYAPPDIDASRDSNHGNGRQ